MKSIDPKYAVAYLRRSTGRQERSIPDQRSEITHWAERNGYRIVNEYMDEVSGDAADTRPGFQKMIADAKRGDFKAVIVWSSDRFSRADMTETEHFRFLLRQSTVKLLSVTEDFVSQEGIEGDVLRAVKQYQNRQFLISLSQNTLRGQISAVLSASDPGRMPPYGYDRELVGPDGAVLYRVRFTGGGRREVHDKHGTLQAHYAPGQSLRKPGKSCTARLVLSAPERVQAVRDIFRWCIEGDGFRAIAEKLNRAGIPSPKGKLWQVPSIKALIENPVYRGDIVWNRRTGSKFFHVRNGRADAMRPPGEAGTFAMTSKDDWIVIPDAVPPLLKRNDWERAQVAAAARASMRGGCGKHTNRWLLSGVLRCACCGQPFWGVRKRKGKKAGRKPIVTPYYICSGRNRCGPSLCPHSVHVRADRLEQFVLDQVQACIFEDGESVNEAVERFVESAREDHGIDVDSRPIRAELEQIDRTVNALVTGLDPANIVLVNDKLSSLRQRKEALQARLRECEAIEAELDEPALRSWATERLKLFGEIVAGRRDDKARQAIASYVESIVFDPGTRTGELYLFDGPEDSPGDDDGEGGAGCGGDGEDGPGGDDGSTGGPKTTRPAEGRVAGNSIAGVGFEPTTSGL